MSRLEVAFPICFLLYLRALQTALKFGDLKVFEEGSALFIPALEGYSAFALYNVSAIVESQSVGLAVDVIGFSHG
jgi:hypothetical protein